MASLCPRMFPHVESYASGMVRVFLWEVLSIFSTHHFCLSVSHRFAAPATESSKRQKHHNNNNDITQSTSNEQQPRRQQRVLALYALHPTSPTLTSRTLSHPSAIHHPLHLINLLNIPRCKLLAHLRIVFYVEFLRTAR